MYTAMAMEREMQARGMKATFRATGQTGILITGDGVPLDAVVADFMAGAVEWLTPDNDPDHWDLIEGQGSLFPRLLFRGDAGAHPWRATRCADPLPRADACPHARAAGLRPAHAADPAGDRPAAGADREPGLRGGRHVASTRSRWTNGRQRITCTDLEAETGLPATDPYRFGSGKLVDALAAI